MFDGPGPPTQKSVLRGEYAFTYNRPDWRRVDFNLSSLTGQTNLAFRFRFASDVAVTEDGIYIDNVEIRERNPSSSSLTIYGAGYGDQFGYSVAAMESATGSTTVSDLAVGAPYADAGFATDAGAAYVFSGSTTLGGYTTAASADATSEGANANAGNGWSVQSLTDFNDSSAVYLFSGAPLTGGNQGGGALGNVTEAIPELSDVVMVVGITGVLVVATSARRHRGKQADEP